MGSPAFPGLRSSEEVEQDLTRVETDSARWFCPGKKRCGGFFFFVFFFLSPH